MEWAYHIPADYPRAIDCPICGKNWEANGVGPTRLKGLTRFLQWLPSGELFDTAARVHDLCYLVGPMMPIVVHMYGKEWLVITKDDADTCFLDLMLMAANDSTLWPKWLMRRLAYAHYEAVVVGGSKSWEHTHE